MEQKDTETRVRIGKEIAALREKMGLTQKELADIVNLKSSAVSRIENGKLSVGIDMLSKIADTLNHNVELVKKRKHK